MQLDFHIENRYTEKECVQAILKWLSEGDYTPDDIIKDIQYGIELNYQPLYIFQREYNGNAFAQLGVTRRVSYVVNGNTQYRTVTD